MNEKKRLPVALLAIIDVLLIAGGVGLMYLYLTALPQVYAVVEETPRASVTHAPLPTSTLTVTPSSTRTTAPTRTATRTAAPSERASGASALARATATPTAARTATRKAAPTIAPSATPAPTQLPVAPPSVPPAGFTSGEVIQTANAYRSANISITLTRTQRKGVTFYVQDVYVKSVENLRTAFARNTYGRAIADWAVEIAKANNAIGAINGDYYGAGVIGAVIRNGKLYNAQPEGDVCVLFRDGTMKTYAPREFDAEQAMAAGAWQAWDFGPALMTPEGKAIGKFDSGIAGLNPRTAIGYVEPGHYLFVVVDGRQPGYSNGMTLAQLAALFEELGAKVAYNLDGGQTSVMTFGGQVVNRPYRGGRKTSDIIYVGE